MQGQDCNQAEQIRQSMRDAAACRNGLFPGDTTTLLVELDNHRRNCPVCTGKIYGQLFAKTGKVVVVCHAS